MYTIYGIKNCSTMKKAFNLLDELNISYEFHDYKKLGITTEILKNWLDHVDADVLLNKRGTTWRKLSEEEQQYALSSQENLIETFIHHTSLIKRPVLVQKDKVIVGFDEAQYKAL